MKHCLYNKIIKPLIALFVFGILLMPTQTAFALTPLISSVDGLVTAIMNANDGETILVGDITFNPMPKGMIIVQKNITIKSGKNTNAVFTNATFALNGTTTDSAPLKVKFENIDFKGDQAGSEIDPEAPPAIGSSAADIMKTMCASIFKMNVDATYVGCTFEGYHYAHGGVFNAIYSSADNKNALNIKLDGCLFKNNASKYGGSIYLSGYNHNITLDARHCVFEDNAAATGGAIWAEESDISLFDCSFVGNKYLNVGASSPNGGALALYSCGTEFDGCLIAYNTSGDNGAGVFCELSPFKKLIMQNCTVVGNSAANDDGIAITLTETNYDTAAMAHIYFSLFMGRQSFADHAELFGCILAEPEGKDEEPSAENGYCLTMPLGNVRDMLGTSDLITHGTLAGKTYLIPKDVTNTVAGGKFANSLCGLNVGDNYFESITVNVESAPGKAENTVIKYGETLVLEEPARSGYSFTGWKYSDGTAFENGKIFMGGELSEAKIVAGWQFELAENVYVIWIPLAVAVVIAIAVIFIKRKKTSTEPIVDAETSDFPEDWIDHACEKPEITELISKREMEVLHKLLEGKSRKQIADELFVTEATIRKHSTSIYSKLGVHNRTELVYKLTKQ